MGLMHLNIYSPPGFSISPTLSLSFSLKRKKKNNKPSVYKTAVTLIYTVSFLEVKLKQKIIEVMLSKNELKTRTFKYSESSTC